jgi:hypothetical protein
MKALKLAAAITALFTLTAGSCAHTGVARPDSTKLVCKDEPELPAGDPATGAVSDEQDARYKGELRGAWYDCHSTVTWLRDWFAKLPD